MKTYIFLLSAVLCFFTAEAVKNNFNFETILASLFTFFGVIFVLYFVEALFIERELKKGEDKT